MRGLLTSILFACLVCGQATFEVATVRPANAAKLEKGLSMGMQFAGPQFRADGYTLKGLVQWAYELQEFQVSGGPGWFDKDRFDVNAKVPDGADTRADANRARLRVLLAERFHLSAHRETKQATILVLTVNKGGPTLKAPHAPGGASWGPSSVRAQNAEVSLLARALSSAMGQQVIDRTGLDGKYDYELKWEADPARGEGPSVFTALQEQLGLRLDSEKGPLEVLVVDRAERPTDN